MTRTDKSGDAPEKPKAARTGRRYDISTARQLRALTSPVRHQIHQLVDACGPCSARELAHQMGRSAESLYYHLHQLERAGLLLEVGKRRGLRRSEASYDVVGRPYRVDPTITDPQLLELVSRCAAARLRFAARSLDEAITDRDATRQGKYRSWRMEQYTVRLSKKDSGRLNKMIDDVMMFLRTHNDASGDALHAVTIAASKAPQGQAWVVRDALAP